MPDSSVTTPRSFGDIEQAIKAAVYTPIAELRATAWVTPEPVPFAERRQGRKLALRPGQRWSKAAFDCAWFPFTGTVRPAAAGKQTVLQEAAIAIRNPELYALHYDFEVLHALLQQLPDDSSRAVQLRRALEKAGDLLRGFTKEEAVAARAVLRPELVRRNKAAPLTVWAVGHA